MSMLSNQDTPENSIRLHDILSSSLMEQYKSHCCNINRLYGRDYSLDDLYLSPRLEIISGREEINQQCEDTLIGHVGPYEKKEKPVTLNDNLFFDKLIYLEGEAGVGKTTLCRYLMYSWSTDVLLSKFDFLLYIPLGDWNGDLLSVFTMRCEPGSDATALYKKSKILYLLDSYDELPFEKRRLLQKEILQSEKHFAIFSRPGMVELGPGTRLKMSGFSDLDIESYIERLYYLEEMEKEVVPLKRFINGSAVNHTHARLPVVLDLLCSGWLHSSFKQHSSSSITLNSIFTDITIAIITRASGQAGGQAEGSGEDKTAILQQRAADILGRVALGAILRNEFFFSRELLNTMAMDSNCSVEELLSFGPIVCTAGPDELENGKYNFSHRILQDYFCAYYVAKQFNADAMKDFISHHKLDVRYCLIFKLMTGFLSGDQRNDFFDELMAPPDDIIGFYSTHLAASCLVESGFNQSIEQRAVIIKKFKEWIKVAVVENRLGRSDIMDKCSSIINAGGQVFTDTAQILSGSPNLPDGQSHELSNNNVHAAGSTKGEKALLSLIDGLADNDEMIKEVSAEGLGHLLFNKPDDRVINSLCRGLQDRYSSVRFASAVALGRLGWACNKTLYALLKGLKDNDLHVRRVSALALGSIGKAKSSVLGELVRSLSENRSSGSGEAAGAAAEALGLIGFAHTKVLKELMLALGSKHAEVRYASAEALGNIGHLHPKIFNAILSVMKNDTDTAVSEISAIALLKLGGIENQQFIRLLLEKFPDIESMPANILIALPFSSLAWYCLSEQKEETWSLVYWKAITTLTPVYFKFDNQLCLGNNSTENCVTMKNENKEEMRKIFSDIKAKYLRA